jgi:hypothetical protein
MVVYINTFCSDNLLHLGYMQSDMARFSLKKVFPPVIFPSLKQTSRLVRRSFSPEYLMKAIFGFAWAVV